MKNIKKNLLAFYGGTFDPIHYGHLIAIMSLLKNIYLEKVIFLPNYIPPHKYTLKTNPIHRLNMLKLAISEISSNFIEIDTREFYNRKQSWTIETFVDIRKEYGKLVPICFILGEDSFFTLPTWKCGSKILSFCHLLVCTRMIKKKKSKIKNLNVDFFKHVINDPKELLYHPHGSVYFSNTIKFNISSSEIRKRYKNDLPCKNLLPSSVQRYIKENNLYI